MDWASITRAEWISAFSACVAVLSASYTWRNYRLSARKERRELDATKPIIQVSPWGLHTNVRPWGRVVVSITNRHPHTLHLASIRLKGPVAGKIGWLRDKPNGSTKVVNSVLIREEEVVEHPERFYRPRSSAVGPATSSNSSANFAIYLRPIDRDAIYLVELDLEERLVDIRRSMITLKISVPALTNSAPRATQSARDM